jgi:twitching motility protein PilT
MMQIRQLLGAVVKFHASDLHVQVGSPPSLRIHGDITPLELPELSMDDVDALVREIADESTLAEISTQRSADFSYVVPDLARFRVNVFYESGKPCLCLRHIPLDIPELESLNMPDVIVDIAEAERGLVLVTGTTGSGKSTTLAAVIDYLNRTRRLRILTIEDPIEFVHTSKKSLIAQREVGTDTPSFAESLRRALRRPGLHSGWRVA